jgi:hypothetical protein
LTHRASCKQIHRTSNNVLNIIYSRKLDLEDGFKTSFFPFFLASDKKKNPNSKWEKGAGNVILVAK